MLRYVGQRLCWCECEFDLLREMTQMGEGEDGSAEQQAAFMRELEDFHRDKALDFKAPKFYGELLNCLK